MSIAQLYSAANVRTAFEPAQPDGGVDFELRAHPRRAVDDAFGQRRLGAAANVLDGKILFQRRDHLHRVDLAPVRRRNAVDDAGLVEMDMRLDQPGADQPPAGIVSFAGSGQGRLDSGDPSRPRCRYCMAAHRAGRRGGHFLTIRSTGVPPDSWQEGFARIRSLKARISAITASASGRSKSKSIALTPRSRNAWMSPMMSLSLPENSRRSPSEARRRQRFAVPLDAVGQRHRVARPAGRLGGAAQPLDAGAVARQAVEQMRVVGADRIPGVAELGGAAQRRPALAADPDRRVRLLHRLRLEQQPVVLHIFAVDHAASFRSTACGRRRRIRRSPRRARRTAS